MNYIIKKASALTEEEKTERGLLGIPPDWPIEIYVYTDVILDGFELIASEDLDLLRLNNQAAYDAWLQGLRPIVQPVSNVVDVKIVSQSEPPPFALPTYRTKHDAIGDIVSIPINSYGYIDFKVLSELYISGGSILVENAEFGDYVRAEVVDVDSVIPTAYRTVLCENWPTVASYIDKAWIEVSGSTISKHRIDTSPLNAKITSGLYLRVAYYTVNSGSERHVAVNYYLTKKL